jgi:uracil-DNA glycosylase family 4
MYSIYLESSWVRGFFVPVLPPALPVKPLPARPIPQALPRPSDALRIVAPKRAEMRAFAQPPASPSTLNSAFRQALPALGHAEIRASIIGCELCPRLREYCTRLGEVRRRAYIDHIYWSRPVPGFGDPNARILILGLAPGAHGANRTGRPFTGDGAGNFMYPVLHELGLASSPNAVSRDDGLKLRHAWICSVVRCAPPADKPTPQEVRNCAIHLAAEIQALKKVRVVVCLGKIAWDGFLAHLLRDGVIARRSEYTFGHGVEYVLPNGLYLLASYHPSLRNTNTGRLNRTMFARVFVRARELAGLG